MRLRVFVPRLRKRRSATEGGFVTGPTGRAAPHGQWVVVPKRREEVSVERVPVEGREAAEAEIGEDEIVVPVTEEEVVVEKRPEVKEEIRLRKDVVQEEEVVEEGVRREEVEIEDDTERRAR